VSVVAPNKVTNIPTQDGLTLSTVRASLDMQVLGHELHERIRRLYPICRSITGNGVRETLRLVSEEINIDVEEVPSGTQVFDWKVPKEWNIHDAYIKNSDGRRVIDFQASNLHVMSYSVPVHAKLTLAELRPHLFSIPDRPDWIPYKTSYYAENWGFCISHRQLESLREDVYEVCIDSSLKDGHLTLAECVLPGEERDEILFSCHVCHPSLCNDNLSGISVAVSLARLLANVSRRHTCRFLFIPGTIGSIAWLARHTDALPRIKHGLVLACVGDRGNSTYKRSRRGDAAIDRAVSHVLQSSGNPFGIVDFAPWGYDERQYCSPGINLSVGVLSRTPHGQFAEYHTSADNVDFVDSMSLADTVSKCLAVLEVLEGDNVFVNQNPCCEPQLGKRGLYSRTGGHSEDRQMEAALLWVLNFSDGTHSLLDIAERSGLPFSILRSAADKLVRHDLLRVASQPSMNDGTAAVKPRLDQGRQN
jgi:aminopeptidase-like protein